MLVKSVLARNNVCIVSLTMNVATNGSAAFSRRAIYEPI